NDLDPMRGRNARQDQVEHHVADDVVLGAEKYLHVSGSSLRAGIIDEGRAQPTGATDGRTRKRNDRKGCRFASAPACLPGTRWRRQTAATPFAQRAHPPGELCMSKWDLLFRNALLIDGSGEAARNADLAIAAGRVAAIGRLDPGAAAAVRD